MERVVLVHVVTLVMLLVVDVEDVPVVAVNAPVKIVVADVMVALEGAIII